ncbi:MAG: hypothetical protein JWR21_975 [Herminiimonas sp.]|nr:hypothetical protein [Herminiimonas sp.]
MRMNRSTIRPSGLLFLCLYIGVVYWVPLVRRNVGMVAAAMLFVAVAVGGMSARAHHQQTTKAHAASSAPESHASNFHEVQNRVP